MAYNGSARNGSTAAAAAGTSSASVAGQALAEILDFLDDEVRHGETLPEWVPLQLSDVRPWMYHHFGVCTKQSTWLQLALGIHGVLDYRWIGFGSQDFLDDEVVDQRI